MLCPWDRFAPATLEFCESLLNGWVRQPANTWSNIGFVIVGLLLWRRTPSDKPWLRIFAIGSLLVGITSAAFHLSMTFVGQFFDVASMFITAGMLVAMNLMRMKMIRPDQIYKVLWAMQLIAMAFMFVFQGGVGESIFALQVTFIVLSEVYLWWKNRPSPRKYRWWMAAVVADAIAVAVWLLDIRKIWCEPDNHWFNGHVVWHLMNAVVVWCLYRFYEEIVEIN